MSKYKKHKKIKVNHTVSQNSIVLGILLISFLILWNYLDFFNKYVLLFLRLGSILLIVNVYFLVKQFIKVSKILKRNYYDRHNWFRYVTYGFFALIILIIFLFLPSQEELKENPTEQLINLTPFNPLYLGENSTNMSKVIEDLNISSLNLDSKKFFNSCPQINVSMNENKYSGMNIRNKKYDGWTIKGDATCRKGTKEGENLNKYYCGGYSSTFGIGSVNAYVQKTIIDKNGNVGKTYKYVIWNIYDENKEFIETQCIGDPDEFKEKQAEAFYNELQKWN